MDIAASAGTALPPHAGARMTMPKARPGRLAALMLGLATPCAAASVDAPIPVPSGQMVTLGEVIHGMPGDDGLAVRFHFITPAIAHGFRGDRPAVDFDTALVDMDHLCAEFALPRVLTGTGPVPAQIIIGFADRPVAFGAAEPDATQFFEAYLIEDDTCVSEAF